MSQLMVHIIPAFKGCFHLLGTKLSFLDFFFTFNCQQTQCHLHQCWWLFLLSQMFKRYCHISYPNIPYSHALFCCNGSIPHWIFCFLFIFSAFLHFFHYYYQNSLISRFVTILITNLVPLLILLFANRLNYWLIAPNALAFSTFPPFYF